MVQPRITLLSKLTTIAAALMCAIAVTACDGCKERSSTSSPKPVGYPDDQVVLAKQGKLHEDIVRMEFTGGPRRVFAIVTDPAVIDALLDLLAKSSSRVPEGATMGRTYDVECRLESGTETSFGIVHLRGVNLVSFDVVEKESSIMPYAWNYFVEYDPDTLPPGLMRLFEHLKLPDDEKPAEPLIIAPQ